MAVRAPDLRPFRAELLVVDVPLVIGLEVVGLRMKVMRHFGTRARTGPRAGGELLDWRASGADGANLDAPDLPRPIGLFGSGPTEAELRKIADTTAALGWAWAGPLMSETRARSLASAYAASVRREIPLMSNATEVWRISRSRSGLAGTTGLVAGSAELMLYLVSCGAMIPDEGWKAYCSLGTTIAGFTPGWSLDRAYRERTRQVFAGWAREAQDGRL